MESKNTLLKKITNHRLSLLKCQKCPKMIGPVVSGEAVLSKVILIGQAPGPKEGDFGKPFAWTAGKTLFKWIKECGLVEEEFRKKVYMAAVCRCFPGKNPKGGDRVPSNLEIANCSSWLETEVKLLKPKLVIPVGKLAISQIIKVDKLKEIIGEVHEVEFFGEQVKVLPLPHPSGASTWHRTEPGKSLLKIALKKLQKQPEWKELLS